MQTAATRSHVPPNSRRVAACTRACSAPCRAHPMCMLVLSSHTPSNEGQHANTRGTHAPTQLQLLLSRPPSQHTSPRPTHSPQCRAQFTEARLHTHMPLTWRLALLGRACWYIRVCVVEGGKGQRAQPS